MAFSESPDQLMTESHPGTLMCVTTYTGNPAHDGQMKNANIIQTRNPTSTFRAITTFGPPTAHANNASATAPFSNHQRPL